MPAPVEPVKSCEGCDNETCQADRVIPMSKRYSPFDVEHVFPDITEVPVARTGNDAVRGGVEDGKNRSGV